MKTQQEEGTWQKNSIFQNSIFTMKCSLKFAFVGAISLECGCGWLKNVVKLLLKLSAIILEFTSSHLAMI